MAVVVPLDCVLIVRLTEDEDDLLLCAVVLWDDRLTVAASTANWLTIMSVSPLHGMSILVVRVTDLSGACVASVIWPSILDGTFSSHFSDFLAGHDAVSTSRLKYWRREMIARRMDRGPRGLRKMKNSMMMMINNKESTS